MTNKKGLSRDEAAELYRDLKKTMNQMNGAKVATPPAASGSKEEIAKQIAAAIKQGMAQDDMEQARPSRPTNSRRNLRRTAPDSKVEKVEAAQAAPSESEREYLLHGVESQSGVRAAIVFVLFFAVCKFGFSAMEASGVFGVEDAHASLVAATQTQSINLSSYSKEEVSVLKSLDARREELHKRSERLQTQTRDLEEREREFAVRLTELRDLSQRLSVERERNERRRDSQLEQLANVYGSMNPKEAALLIEQLDITIAIGLLERMPEKRIGQILSLMSPDRALTMTRMLSGRR